MGNFSKLGDRLEAIRRVASLSQAEIAERLGVSRSAWQNYERGERDLPASLLLKVCEMLNDDAHRLLTGGPSPLLLTRLEHFTHLLDERLEDLDLDISADARQRLLAKVLKDDFRAHPYLAPSAEEEEIDSLIRMIK